jgi:hypothetical protein
VRLQNRPRGSGSHRSDSSGQIERAAAARAGTGKRDPQRQSDPEKTARRGNDRAGIDPRPSARLAPDGTGAQSPAGRSENRHGQSQSPPYPVRDRPLQDARRSNRPATTRANQHPPPLTPPAQARTGLQHQAGHSPSLSRFHHNATHRAWPAAAPAARLVDRLGRPSRDGRRVGVQWR